MQTALIMSMVVLGQDLYFILLRWSLLFNWRALLKLLGKRYCFISAAETVLLRDEGGTWPDNQVLLFIVIFCDRYKFGGHRTSRTGALMGTLLLLLLILLFLLSQLSYQIGLDIGLKVSSVLYRRSSV